MIKTVFQWERGVARFLFPLTVVASCSLAFFQPSSIGTAKIALIEYHKKTYVCSIIHSLICDRVFWIKLSRKFVFRYCFTDRLRYQLHIRIFTKGALLLLPHFEFHFSFICFKSIFMLEIKIFWFSIRCKDKTYSIASTEVWTLKTNCNSCSEAYLRKLSQLTKEVEDGCNLHNTLPLRSWFVHCGKFLITSKVRVFKQRFNKTTDEVYDRRSLYNLDFFCRFGWLNLSE